MTVKDFIEVWDVTNDFWLTMFYANKEWQLYRVSLENDGWHLGASQMPISKLVLNAKVDTVACANKNEARITAYEEV